MTICHSKKLWQHSLKENNGHYMKTHQYIDKPNCPYCGSIQVKGMARQPKKYPKPSDPTALHEWQNGYDCKKCGSEFVAEPLTVANVSKGCFSSIIKLTIGIILIIGVLAYLATSNKGSDKAKPEASSPDAIEQVINQKEKEAINRPAVEMPSTEELNDTFSTEAEAAAHGDYDSTPAAVDRPESKTHESEHLTITETIHS